MPILQALPASCRQAERSALSAECTAPTSLKTLLPFSRPSRPAHQEADAMLHFLATGAGGEELEVSLCKM